MDPRICVWFGFGGQSVNPVDLWQQRWLSLLLSTEDTICGKKYQYPRRQMRAALHKDLTDSFTKKFYHVILDCILICKENEPNSLLLEDGEFILTPSYSCTVS